MKTPFKSFTFKGKKYEAKPQEGCEGCAFEFGSFGCDNHPSYCSAPLRPDGKYVIWIEVKKS